MNNKKLRLALIGTNGIPANYGGAETLYENLTRELSDRYDITVYCSNRQSREIVGDTFLGAKLKYWPMSANGLQSLPYDYLSLLHAWRNSDVLYVFGFGPWFMVWLMRLFGCKKRILFNHGGLNEWMREKSPWYGKLNGRMGRRLLRNKVIHIADNSLQLLSLKECFNIRDVKVIRYGADHCRREAPDKELIEKFPFLKDEYFVSVSRAQVDNNLHVLLEAFANMPEHMLVLVSNFTVSDYGRALYEKYSKGYPNIILIPGVYDKKELNAIRSNSVAYIHSHSRCGTPPSLCEAMYLGLPIISFDAEVNHEVTNEHAFFFSDSKSLMDIIDGTSKESLVEMSELSSSYARDNYTWKHISEQYIDVIEKY